MTVSPRRKFGPYIMDHLLTTHCWQDARRVRDAHRRWGARIVTVGGVYHVYVRPPPDPLPF